MAGNISKCRDVKRWRNETSLKIIYFDIDKEKIERISLHS